MKKLKRLIVPGVGCLLVLFLTISILTPYPGDEERNVAERIYESSIKTSDISNTVQILLRAEQANSQELSLLSLDQEEVSEEKAITIRKDSEYTWDFMVETAGEYQISAGYFLMDGNGQDLKILLSVDGIPVANGDSATLTRLWTDSGTFKKTAAGDEMRPEQQSISLWQEENFKVSGQEDIKLRLEPGKHTLLVKGIREEGLISYIRFYQKESGTYQEYFNHLLQQGKTTEIPSDVVIKVQAEVPYLKSSPVLYPSYDRSSALTSPYHPTSIRYNTIGGSNWSREGQWIEWKFNIEQQGFYQIGMRYRQKEKKGADSLRKFYIDGEESFQELGKIAFPYNTGWQNRMLGDTEPFYFYFTRGEHTIRMEATLDSLTVAAEQMDQTVYSLNALYREIIIITGTEPDIYRDYHLETAIPDLTDKLSFVLEELKGYEKLLEELYGANSYSSRVVSQLKRQMESFLEKPYTIQKRLSMLKTNISAMAEWVLEFKNQPLELDCIYLTGIGANLPKAEDSIVGKTGHEIRSFLGSFFHNYSDISGGTDEDKNKTITVWLGKGRDQANVIKRLIDEYFTPETGIQVNLSIVEGALVKAAIAGKGPDVNMFTTRGEAMNLAFRGALTSFDFFEGFPEMVEQYRKNAFIPYTYQEKHYGIPEEQIFYMMFIRTDVLSELSLAVPETWNDIMELIPVLKSASLGIGLPYTDGYAVMNGGVGTQNLLPTLLAQQGISIYNKDNTKVQLIDSGAYQSFKRWTDFYTMYDFDLYIDPFNRFRTGELPIIIAPYQLYNNLAEAAPELAGQWIMTRIPGTVDQNGAINRATSAGGNATILLRDCKNKEAAWEFIKWWNSPKTQEKYSKEIETELSLLGRYTPANQIAFQNTNWFEEEKAVLLAQWNEVVEIPEVPGGYYTSRNIDNAFRDVYYNGENARESLYYWMNGVNEELERKQNQIKLRAGKEDSQ